MSFTYTNNTSDTIYRSSEIYTDGTFAVVGIITPSVLTSSGTTINPMTSGESIVVPLGSGTTPNVLLYIWTGSSAPQPSQGNNAEFIVGPDGILVSKASDESIDIDQPTTGVVNLKTPGFLEKIPIWVWFLVGGGILLLFILLMILLVKRHGSSSSSDNGDNGDNGDNNI